MNKASGKRLELPIKVLNIMPTEVVLAVGDEHKIQCAIGYINHKETRIVKLKSQNEKLKERIKFIASVDDITDCRELLRKLLKEVEGE